jgi:transcriptional regulator with XRE-family HTH domain
MNRVRFGRSVKALRLRKGWRQEDLARAARVSRSAVGRIEAGEIGRMAWWQLLGVAEALDGQLDLDFRWRGADLDRLVDADHAAVQAALTALYRRASWETAVEATFSQFGERGSIDVLAWHPGTSQVAVNEVKVTVPEAGTTLEGLDRKARLAPLVARDQGWTCHGVSRFLVVADRSTARRRVAAATVFDAALPLRGAACTDWIRSPNQPVKGLFFLSPAPPPGASLRTRTDASGATLGGPRR